MAILTTEEIMKATDSKLLSRDSEPSDRRKLLLYGFSGVSIDSRTISEGEIFFALRGQRFDGHDFLKEALLRGDGAVVDSKPAQIPEGKVIIYVEDTLKALQDLAHFLIVRRNIPVIAITGSNGKTTTKEMTYKILSRRFNVLKNEGNLNNHIGLPLSLTKLTPNHEVVVLELGMNAVGEIKRLCEIAVPSHGVITNIGSAHVGGLGGLDSIRSAKFEILRGLNVIVLNADDGFLMEGYESILRHEGFDGRLITFSINNDSDVRAEDVITTQNGSSFTLKVKGGESITLRLNVHGLFNVYNAIAASAVCLSLGIAPEEIKTSLESYTAFPMRFKIIRGNKITLIDDSYNANPSSMEQALRELIRMRDRGRVVAVLGDMLELGKFSEQLHGAIVKMVFDIGVNVFVAVGEMMSLAAQKSQSTKSDSHPVIYIFKDADEVRHNISGILKEGDVVLIKGSRAMGMEKIVERIIV